MPQSIQTCEELKAEVEKVERQGASSRYKTSLYKRALELGCPDAIPDHWNIRIRIRKD